MCTSLFRFGGEHMKNEYLYEMVRIVDLESKKRNIDKEELIKQLILYIKEHLAHLEEST